MQFISNGPEIPESLLHAHEEGNAIFFCGAGISYPAGLPLFEGLVNDIYDSIGEVRSPTEEEAFKECRYDATLHLLERRFPGQRMAVRKALAEILRPNLRLKGASDTHESLLRLGRNRNNQLRLVTTNFDRIFEKVGKNKKVKFNSYSAPMLPIPKNSKWDGLVYLHGLLPEKINEPDLQKLIVTSGDFGLAYLTERWASRFVSELFRNYVVCFVGYGINDPVLRYIMDALAADAMQGESSPEAYAFGHYNSGEYEKIFKEWEAKFVTPILYEVPNGTHDHSALHKTIKRWSETHRDGLSGKEQIITKYAITRPSESTVQDDFVGRMLWAISDPSGVPARIFADFIPAPDLEWLNEFSKRRYEVADLERFGVIPNSMPDNKFQFSLISRPPSLKFSPFMELVSSNARMKYLDEAMFQIGRWLTRHLNNPDLIFWVMNNGAVLHPVLSSMIERELIKDQKNCISSEMMVLWRMVLGTS